MNMSFDKQVQQEMNTKRGLEELDESVEFVCGSFENMRPLDATPPMPNRKKRRTSTATTPTPSDQQTIPQPPTSPKLPIQFTDPGPSCSSTQTFQEAVTSIPTHRDKGDDEEMVGGVNLLETMQLLDKDKIEIKNIHKEWVTSIMSSWGKKCRSLKQRHLQRCLTLNKQFRALQLYRKLITGAMGEMLNQVRQSEGLIRELDDMERGIPIPFPSDVVADWQEQ